MRLLLIRHAHGDHVGRVIAGRAAGVHLSEQGRGEACALAERLGTGTGITAIYSSPMERARETAQPLAERLGLEVSLLDDLNEMDYGEWTGRSMDELERDPRWRKYHADLESARAPGGESLIGVRARAARLVERLAAEHPDETIAAFSHAETIRLAVAWCLGVAIENALRIEVEPAAVTTVEIGRGAPRLLRLNG